MANHATRVFMFRPLPYEAPSRAPARSNHGIGATGCRVDSIVGEKSLSTWSRGGALGGHVVVRRGSALRGATPLVVNERADVEEMLRASRLFYGEALQVRPLQGGITNRNYVVTTDRGEFVVRIPGERTALLGITRAHEAEASRRAAALGIGPAVLGLLENVGTLVTELVAGHHLEPTPFAERLEDVVDLIRRFHESGPLAGAFPIHRIVEWHARDASAYGVMAPPAYERLHHQSRRFEAAFAKAPKPLVPGDNDLLPATVWFVYQRLLLPY